MSEAITEAIGISIMGGCALLFIGVFAVARSWWKLFSGLLLVTFGIVIPGLVFVFSAMLIPSWKGEARFGWWSCFQEGKFALAPLVLWGFAAFFVCELCYEKRRGQRWVVLGMSNAAIVSGVCFVVGLFLHLGRDEGVYLFLPLYVAMWYGMRARALMSDFPPGRGPTLWSLFASTPFWIASILWSKHTYLRLPDEVPNCFIVTAASRGTPGLVGPLCEVAHGGVVRSANLQLHRFWQLEELWRLRSPWSHRWFRRVYNRAGPVIARRIRRPAVANVVYLALKPFEGLAVLVLWIRRSAC